MLSLPPLIFYNINNIHYYTNFNKYTPIPLKYKNILSDNCINDRSLIANPMNLCQLRCSTATSPIGDGTTRIGEGITTILTDIVFL